MGTKQDAEVNVAHAGKRKVVALQRISLHPALPETRGHDVGEVAESILQNGLLHPVLVRPHPDDVRRFQLLAGSRRFGGIQALAAREGVPRKIPVVVREVDDAEALRLALRENLDRRRLTPLEQASLVGGLRNAVTVEEGAPPTVRELAELVPLSKSAIGEALQIADALADSELGPPLRRAGSQAKKKVLVEILSNGDRVKQLAALDLLSEGSPRRSVLAALKSEAEATAPSPGLPTLERTDRAGELKVILRVTTDTAADQLRSALAELAAVRTQLEAMLEAAAAPEEDVPGRRGQKTLL